MTPEELIRVAMDAAEDAARRGNRPFGAVVSDGDGVIAAVERNRVTELGDATHAEVNAIRGAQESRGVEELTGFSLYTNAQPCPSCFRAIVAARISALYYASPAAPGTWTSPSMNELRDAAPHGIEIRGGILASEAALQIDRLSRDPERRRLDELTRRWRARHDVRRPGLRDRPRADAERQARAAVAFPYRSVSPADYAAAHGADMPGFTYDEERYDDPELDAWLVELGQILRERRA